MLCCKTPQAARPMWSLPRPPIKLGQMTTNTVARNVCRVVAQEHLCLTQQVMIMVVSLVSLNLEY
jgi:hypothetical protein